MSVPLLEARQKSGRASRRKGRKGEYLVRDHLRRLGFEAHRVPSSGAAEGFKGDIKAELDGKTILFEVKLRKNAFKSIYTLFAELTNTKVNGFVYKKTCIGMSLDVKEVLALDKYFHIYPYPASKFPIRSLDRLLNLSKLLGTADVLVIKDDHRPLLFIRYCLSG